MNISNKKCFLYLMICMCSSNASQATLSGGNSEGHNLPISSGTSGNNNAGQQSYSALLRRDNQENNNQENNNQENNNQENNNQENNNQEQVQILLDNEMRPQKMRRSQQFGNLNKDFKVENKPKAHLSGPIEMQRMQGMQGEQKEFPGSSRSKQRKITCENPQPKTWRQTLSDLFNGCCSSN